MEKPEDVPASCASACSAAPPMPMDELDIDEWFSYLVGAVIRAREGQPLSDSTMQEIDRLKRLAILGSGIVQERDFRVSEEVAAALERLAARIRSE